MFGFARSVPKHRSLPALLLVVLMPLLAALGGRGVSPAAAQSGAASPEAASGPAAEILDFAAQRLQQTQSLHFDLKIDGNAWIDEGHTIQLVSAKGDLVRPDRVQAEFKAKIAGLAISTIGLITIADQSWTTNIITGKWEPAASEFGYNPVVLFSDTDGLYEILTHAPAAEQLPDEKVDGHEAYRIHTTGDEALIGGITASTMSGYPVGIDLWIDKETGDLLKIVLVEAPSPDNDEPATWTVELSQFNQDLKIEPPDIGAAPSVRQA